MSAATFLLGDVFEVMATMPDRSVDLVLTSPPFLALRSYLPPDHPDKHKEIGSEPTPAEFLDTLLALTAEWGRLITATGSIAVELGDTYAGSGGAGGDYAEGGLRDGQGKADGAKRRMTVSARRDRAEVPRNETGGSGWPMDKSMCIIPHLYAASLAYGRNILTGADSPAGCWRVRNVIAWCRPNPAVGALGDKVRPATSFMVIATRARDRWFDLDAVRTPLTAPDKVQRNGGARTHESRDPDGKETNEVVVQNPAGAPPLDHVGLRDGEADLFLDDAWLVSTQAYRGSHYATWPEKLLHQPILSMCPREVCTTCGEPRRRITERDEAAMAANSRPVNANSGGRAAKGGRATAQEVSGLHVDRTITTTVGWTDCGHDTWRRGHVLDPFGGSGTTAVVATGHARDCTLIDLDERNIDLARERVGMFLTVADPEEAA